MLGWRDRVSSANDTEGRMRPEALPEIEGPVIVCVQHGNVNSGAFDPALPIVEWARRRGGWVHVDGAFGLWARAAPARAVLSKGAELADSWATDAHKWLNVPYDCGIAIVRERPRCVAPWPARRTQRRRLGACYTPELSRRARGVEVWTALKALGRSGVAELVEDCCRHARRFAQGLRQAGHDVLNDVVLNQVLVSFRDDTTTRAVIERVQAEGTCWCSGTDWHGRAAMRISVSSWATDARDGSSAWPISWTLRRRPPGRPSVAGWPGRRSPAFEERTNSPRVDAIGAQMWPQTVRG
jgi:glutamate/tyrosine decarboxylase-like PLP-dependent enzyme